MTALEQAALDATVAAEFAEIMGHPDFCRIYYSGKRIQLDGDFTSRQLREIANLLDKYSIPDIVV